MFVTRLPFCVRVVATANVAFRYGVDQGYESVARNVLQVLPEMWVSLAALVEVVISGAAFVGPGAFRVVSERLESVGLGEEVPLRTCGLKGLVRL